MEDFEQCTPSEFHAIYHAWQKRELQMERSSWERIRMECLCMLQPHSKKKLHARDVMEFPWEKEERGKRRDERGEMKEERPKMSAAEIAERFEAAKMRFGLK